MVFYRLKLHSQPELRFACATSVLADQTKRNIIDHRENMLELTLNTKLTYTLEDGYGTHILQPNSITLFTPDDCYVISHTAEKTDVQDKMEGTLFSVAVCLSSFELTRHETGNDFDRDSILLDEQIDSALLLPEIMQLSEKDAQNAAARIRMILHHYYRSTPSEHIRCIAGWYELLAWLDEVVRERLAQEHPEMPCQEEAGASFYIYKTKSYIRDHYSESIRVPEIAASLGISPNYLSNIFKKGSGISIIGYLNRFRILRIRELMNRYPEEKLSALCAAVGIHDIRYAERLFRRYMGTTMTLCQRLDSGLTLLHTNPWEQTDVEHDIYNEEHRQ